MNSEPETHKQKPLLTAEIRNLLLLCFLLTLLNSGYGQGRRVFMLQKKNSNKSAYYEVGDELTFYREGRRKKIKDQIMAIEDSVLVFRGYKVHINEITALHIDEKTRWWLRFKASQLLLLGGSVYFVVDVINNGEVSPKTVALSGTMIGVGIICRLLIPEKIKLNRRTRIRILKL